MSDDNEESISVTVEDCKRWSEEINGRLKDIRTKDGEDAYKLAFMTGFLLLWFAQSIETEPGASLTISKPGSKELN